MLRKDAIQISTPSVRRWTGAVLGAVLLFVGACAGELKSDRQLARERVNAYIAAHPELDPNIADALRELDLVEGMTPDQVIAARGKPVIVEKSLNGTSELWYFSCEYPNNCKGYGGKRRRGVGSEETRHQSRAFFVNGRLAESQY